MFPTQVRLGLKPQASTISSFQYDWHPQTGIIMVEVWLMIGNPVDLLFHVLFNLTNCVENIGSPC